MEAKLLWIKAHWPESTKQPTSIPGGTNSVHPMESISKTLEVLKSLWTQSWVICLGREVGQDDILWSPPTSPTLILGKLTASPNPFSQFLLCNFPVDFQALLLWFALMHAAGREEFKEGGRHSKMQRATSFRHLLGVCICILYYPA